MRRISKFHNILQMRADIWILDRYSLNFSALKEQLFFISIYIISFYDDIAETKWHHVPAPAKKYFFLKIKNCETLNMEL